MVQWRLLKRFKKYPADLEYEKGPLRVLSPCYSLYLDIKRDTNEFVIRDTFTS